MFGVSVAREVDEIPFVVDDEMVDEQRLAWRRRSLCQVLVVSQHVDKAGFSYVAPADESVFRLHVFRAHRQCGIAQCEF